MILYSQVGQVGSRVCPGTCSSIADHVRNWLPQVHRVGILFSLVRWLVGYHYTFSPALLLLLILLLLLLLAPEPDAVYSASYVALNMAQGRPPQLMD